DFNNVLDNKLNRKPQICSHTNKILPLYKWLQNQNFIDTFWFLHPTIQKFTWSNGKSSSRINQVWVLDDLSRDLQVADIINMEMITESDHRT
ncbi:26677_t:CDS:1, partial [Gigaspora margarita]